MDKMQKDGKLNSESTLKIKSNLDFKICSCKQKVLKDDWEDHQIVCPKRRLTCPAFVSFLSAISKFEQPCWKIYGEQYAEFSLPLVESNCPPTLKELTKLQILRSIGNLEKLKTSRVPSAIIHTLRLECPTFSTKAELNKHLVGSCFYFKVQCLFSPVMRPGLYDVHATNCHNNDICPKLELSRQEFHIHSDKAALDPISQRLPSTPNIFPYHCSLCDHYFLNSDTHICMPSPPIPKYDIICHGCKSKLDQPRKTPYELENACQVCYDPDNNFLNSDTHPIPEYDIICHGCKSKLDQPRKTPYELENSCKVCYDPDNNFLNSYTHPIPEYDIICHGCKSKLYQPKKTHYELENTCQVCCNQDNNNPIVVGMVGMVNFHNENQKMQWKNVKQNIIKSYDKIHGTEASINNNLI